jgi:peptide/nickel transport system ATP-binding protein
VSIPGTPPRLDRDIVGCSFAPRCDSAFDACRAVAPARLQVGPGHDARCHLNDPSVRTA